MGSGKSFLGRKMAKKHQLNFVEMDSEIEAVVEEPEKVDLDELSEIEGIEGVERDGNRFIIQSSRGDRPIPHIAEFLVRGGAGVRAVSSSELDLEEVFVRLISKEA